MILEVSGVPEGAVPTMRLQSANVTRVLRSGGRVDSLPLGDYELRVEELDHAGDLWDPTPSRVTLNVRASSAPPVVAVQFRRRGPRIAVRASGLPSYARAPVQVTGPDGFQRTVLTGDSLIDLAPGTYRLVADEIETTDGRFEPLPPTLVVQLPPSGTREAPFTYVAALAALTVQTTGLPGGATADILVTGPGGFSERVDSTVTIRGIPTGIYTARANRVHASGFSFVPDALVRDISISGTARRTIAFNYSIITGALAVAVTGLPPGVAGQVEVSGPDGFVRMLDATTTLTDLAPGQYRLAVREVLHEGVPYNGRSGGLQVTVAASMIAAPAVVEYVGAVGGLDLEVAGLPPDRRADIRLQRPGGPVLTADGSQAFSFLPAGTYLVEARPISVGGFTWYPDVASQQVQVVAQTRRAVTVRYGPSTGSLDVAINGLPSGASALVRVRGPAGFDESFTGSRTLGALVPGIYHITAQPLASGGTLFTPTPDSLAVEVQAGTTVSHVITYSAAGSRLALSVTGLPSGVAAQVQVAGPAGFSTVVQANAVLQPLAPGTYVISALDVTDALYRYAGAPASQTVTLAAGQQASVAVTYAASTGRLTLLVTGLPEGVAAPITVSGSAPRSLNVLGVTTLGDLAPGPWAISAVPTSVAGITYASAPATQTVAIAAGQTLSRTVHYSIAGSVPGPNLAVQGAHITQAIQNLSGDVPLVADRAALLRVFVTAASANTLSPPVRVRLFDGATLFRTITIVAPGAGVPTTVDESTLSATWNAPLAASDLRPNLRLQVDVDPSDQVAEPDETDNVWPRAGTQPVDVRPVAPFPIVFVPVHQSATGSTGDVSMANLEGTYLEMTRRIFPLGAIDASVRATYTTNGPALQSDDANGAWLAVLSELNALRVADGSAAHYYGVVSTSYSSGVAGYAFVPGRVAMGWDRVNSAGRVAAHELGHNFGRQHVAACGSAGSIDSNYPYAGGVIGNTGWNAGTGALVSSSITDIMGYCGAQWVSDYTWNAVFRYRGTGAIAAFGAAPRTSLLVWGRVHRGVVTLEPTVRLVTRAALPERAGRYRLELRDQAGRAMSSVAFEPDAVDHDNEGYAFSFAIPIDAFTEVRLHSVAVIGGRNGTVEQAASAASAAAVAVGGEVVPLRTADGGVAQVPDPRATMTSSGRMRQLTWDQATWPMAMVRDAGSGRVLAWLRRSGDGFVPVEGRVTVVFSNGIQSLTQSFATP